jgi:hypothetical protein
MLAYKQCYRRILQNTRETKGFNIQKQLCLVLTLVSYEFSQNDVFMIENCPLKNNNSCP